MARVLLSAGRIGIVVVVVLCVCSTCLADASAYYARGLQLQAERDYSSAVREFAKALTDPVLGAKACYQAARCYRELANLDEAMEACQKGLGLAATPEDRALLAGLLKDLRFAIVQALIEAHDWEGCAGQLSELAVEYPEESAWYRAKCRMTEGNLDAARRVIEDLVRAFPGSRKAAMYETHLARCDFREGKKDEAFARLAGLAQKYPGDSWIIVECAQLLASELERAGSPEEAAGYYRQLIAADPTGPAVVAWKYSLAFQTYQKGRWADARDAFRGLCRDYPSGAWHQDIRFCLADCHARLHEYQAARDMLTAIVADYPGTAMAQAASVHMAFLPTE